MRVKKTASTILIVLMCIQVLAPTASAQQTQGASREEYRIGPGDRLYVTVPQRPDLSQEFTVGPSGTISVPLIGTVAVSGLSKTEVEGKLLQALKALYPSIRDVDVAITPTLSQVIYVMGEVTVPGKLTFTSRLNLWEAIREAGGPLGTASLDEVRIVKDRTRGGTSQVVNVLHALETGSVDDLPELDGGDTVIVPAEQVQFNQYKGEFGVNVFGSVVNPGIYRLQGDKDLVTAILLAGGHLDWARLSRVTIVRPQPNGTYLTDTVDFRRFVEDGDPLSNPELKPGDTVNVARQNPILYSLKTRAGLIVGTITSIVTLAIVIIEFNDRNKQ